LKDTNSIIDVPGIRVGHATDEEALTGCSVILCESGAVGGVDQRGGAPGTRETDALHPLHLVQNVHAIVLSGGSAFGLDSASGVVRYLEERGVGFDVRVARVPIVPAAILFDLGIGRSDVRPDATMGYQACQKANNETVIQGNVGAGTGATVGKILGLAHAMKGGIGSASIHLGSEVVIGAITAVNSFGDVIDPDCGKIIAGALKPTVEIRGVSDQEIFADTLQVMKDSVSSINLDFATEPGNTVIGVVATNVRLNKEQANKVAQMAQDGIARSIRPAHTMVDGDTIFALSMGDKSADVSLIGAFAAEVVCQAIQNAVMSAQPSASLPSASSLTSSFSKGDL
jgi:L-aminopeptidase/D-esterase-like protein